MARIPAFSDETELSDHYNEEDQTEGDEPVSKGASRFKITRIGETIVHS